jgi:WD40 repeat protein
MRCLPILCVAGAAILLSNVSTGQQPAAGSGCALPAPEFDLKKPNIFNAQQEQWLGDAQATEQEAAYDLLPERESAELERIGQKLLAQLPPTPIHYHFRVYESDDPNGFSIAGGYVYISRKLIVDARSEDELAGVLAHEIGHIYTHQVAIETTRVLKARLGVTSLGGRDDVEDKLQLLFNAPPKDNEGGSEEEEEKDELVADRVGLYALVKAGYSPKALSENLDRVAANKGHTGNIFTDVLGTTNLISMRVRVARKIADSVPGNCKQASASSEEFKAFQLAVGDAPIHPLIPATPGLNAISLQPGLRQPLRQVRFSPDGKFLLAQDGSSIHVLSRGPLKLKFSIDARGASPAHFSPDSAHVVFHYASMRVEKWSVETGKRESSRELVDYEGCAQTSLSPDGRTLVCLSKNSGAVWLKLKDVQTGKVVYENKNFYLPYEYGGPTMVVRNEGGMRVATVLYTQDGRTVLIMAGARAMAFDLDERKQITLSGDLAKIMEGRAVFVDSNKLVHECDWDYKSGSSKDTYKICETSFPDGLPVNNFRIGYQWLEPVTKGANLLIGPFKNAAAMLVDPATGKASASFKLDSTDAYGQTVASENDRGGVSLSELGATTGESAELPEGPLYDVQAAAFSPDGRFLAYSSKLRSTIWDLQTQKRVLLMRPFREVRFDAQNLMTAQYQPANQQPGANYQIDLKTGKSTEGAPFAIDQFQRGDVLVTFQPLDKSGDTTSNIVLQVADPATGKQLWTKRFPHEAPVVQSFENGTLVMTMSFSGDTAAEEMKHAGGKLVKSSDWHYEWAPVGLLIEGVDSRTGDVRWMLRVPMRWGWSDVEPWAAAFGDYVAVHGEANNTTIYRIADGKRTGAFFGLPITGDGKLGLIAATNRDQEVTILDMTTGKELKQVTVDQFPRAMRFIPEKNTLLVLTASQRVYSIELPAPGQNETAKAK